MKNYINIDRGSILILFKRKEIENQKLQMPTKTGFR